MASESSDSNNVYVLQHNLKSDTPLLGEVLAYMQVQQQNIAAYVAQVQASVASEHHETISQQQKLDAYVARVQPARPNNTKRVKVEEAQVPSYLDVKIYEQDTGNYITDVTVAPGLNVHELRVVILCWSADKLSKISKRSLIFNKVNLMFKGEFLEDQKKQILEIPCIRNLPEIYIVSTIPTLVPFEPLFPDKSVPSSITVATEMAQAENARVGHVANDHNLRTNQVLAKFMTAHAEFVKKLGEIIATTSGNEAISQFEAQTFQRNILESEPVRDIIAVNIRDKDTGNHIATIEIGPKHTVNELRSIILWWYADKLDNKTIRNLVFQRKNLMFNCQYLDDPSKILLEIPNIKNQSDIFIATYRERYK